MIRRLGVETQATLPPTQPPAEQTPDSFYLLTPELQQKRQEILGLAQTLLPPHDAEIVATYFQEGLTCLPDRIDRLSKILDVAKKTFGAVVQKYGSVDAMDTEEKMHEFERAAIDCYILCAPVNRQNENLPLILEAEQRTGITQISRGKLWSSRQHMECYLHPELLATLPPEKQAAELNDIAIFFDHRGLLHHTHMAAYYLVRFIDELKTHSQKTIFEKNAASPEYFGGIDPLTDHASLDEIFIRVQILALKTNGLRKAMLMHDIGRLFTHHPENHAIFSRLIGTVAGIPIHSLIEYDLPEILGFSNPEGGDVNFDDLTKLAETHTKDGVITTEETTIFANKIHEVIQHLRKHEAEILAATHTRDFNPILPLIWWVVDAFSKAYEIQPLGAIHNPVEHISVRQPGDQSAIFQFRIQNVQDQFAHLPDNQRLQKLQELEKQQRYYARQTALADCLFAWLSTALGMTQKDIFALFFDMTSAATSLLEPNGKGTVYRYRQISSTNHRLPFSFRNEPSDLAPAR